jgi:hypothetical protein
MKNLNIARKYCVEIGWLYKDAGEFLVIGFGVENLTIPVYIKEKYDSIGDLPILEISYFGSSTANDDNINLQVATSLLKRNKVHKFGYWIIKAIGSYEDIYEFRYNIEVTRFTKKIFIDIINLCVNEIQYFMSIEQK